MANFDFTLSPAATRCLNYRIQSILTHAAQIDFIANKLKAHEMSKSQLEKELWQAFGYHQAIGIDTLMDELYIYGFVKSEVRVEEIIYIDVNLVARDLTFVVNKDGTVTVTTWDEKTFTVCNPQVEICDHLVTISGKRPVRVRRKYYSWVR
jgi:hypothetical protein